MTEKQNRYSQIIEEIFFAQYQPQIEEIEFSRESLIEFANRLNIPVPKNLGDILYSFRYRTDLPERIITTAPKGMTWIIRSIGRSRYKFELSKDIGFFPRNDLVETKILDSTPGLISRYALNDEQALLAKLRYNRLVDIFSGITCYSLQNHLRTSIKEIGQVETDEIYIGVDKRGAHYILPIQAKGGTDRLGIIQVEQDYHMCQAKFPSLIIRCIGAQFMAGQVICMFEFEKNEKGIQIAAEKHYRLVDSSQLSAEELHNYQSRQ